MDEALMKKERLDHILYGVAGFGNRCGHGFKPDWPPAIVFDERPKVAAVQMVKAYRIDLKSGQGF